MSPYSQRLSLIEYAKPRTLSSLAKESGLSSSQLTRALAEANIRIAQTLSIEKPLQVSQDDVRAVEIAGLIKILPGLELEVVPKFLGTPYETWREDFLAIALLTRYGSLLPRENVMGEANGSFLADLLARTVVTLFENNYRRPLRLYRSRTWYGFQLDGEVDPEDLYSPAEEGFRQSGIVLDRQNPFNRTILDAMRLLLKETREGETRIHLEACIRRLSPQAETRKRPPESRLPSRHQRWQELFDLSCFILRSAGLTYDDGPIQALPGFMLMTEYAWEDLVREAFRFASMKWKVQKESHVLGARWQARIGSYVRQAVPVTPDATIRMGGRPIFIVDAKYKGRSGESGRAALSISSSDVYEALAGLDSVQLNKAFLVYPWPADTQREKNEPRIRLFEMVNVGQKQIFGLIADVRGISNLTDFLKLASDLEVTVAASL